MKTAKLIPVLMVGMLLSGCNFKIGKDKITAPKFAKYGDSVSSDSFLNAFVTIDGYDFDFDGQTIKDSAYFDEKTLLSSTELTSKQQGKSTTTVTHNSKEVSKSEDTEIEKGSGKYDKNNNVLKYTVSQKGTSSYKDNVGTTTTNADYSTNMYYQVERIKNHDYVVSISSDYKEYEKYKEIDGSDTLTIENWGSLEVQTAVKYQVYAAFFSVMDDRLYGSLSNYKFYKNDNIYTFVYSKDATEVLTTTMFVDGEYKDVEYAKQHQTTERIYQFTIDGEELSIKESGIYESNTEYLMDFSYYDGSYLKGDVAHYNSEQYFEFSAAPKKVNVKPVDVSKYHYYEAPQSNL